MKLPHRADPDAAASFPDGRVDTRFQGAVREHAGLVARIAASYERDAALVDDLVQEVFLAFWRALPSYRDEAALMTFLARIAHNVCVSHVRRQVRRPREQANASVLAETPDERSGGPAERAELDDRRQRLLDAVRSLPLPLRQVVTLHLEGFSGREIAGTLEITENNAAVRLTRARTALREMMEVST
jgi:RNA polymerase sigma factor (sigma-70 family)